MQGILYQLVAALRNRIEVDALRRRPPRRRRLAAPAPIFLTGLPRSGTTYFQYLFDQDPRLRMLRTWEGERPSPPPALDPESAARRHATSVENAKLMREKHRRQDRRLPPHRRRRPAGVPGHPRPDLREPGPAVDDVGVRATSSTCLHDADLPSCVRVPRPRCCGCCSRARPSNAVGAQVAVPSARARRHRHGAPDARFVVTHRDPVQALASNCSLTHMLRAGTSPTRRPASTSVATCSSSCASTSTAWSRSTSSRRSSGAAGSCTSTTTNWSTHPRR